MSRGTIAEPLEPLVLEPLHEQVRRALLDLILRGEVKAGRPLSENRIAAQLGVSRTPVREALARLQQEGWLRVEARRGVFVEPLRRQEAAELYPILKELEYRALLWSPASTAQQLQRLTTLNDAMRDGAQDAASVLEANEAWHAALIASCPNQSLRTMTAAVRTKLYRYEFAYFHAQPGVGRSHRMHKQIITALRKGDRSALDAALSAHYLETLDDLLTAVWPLEERGDD